MFLYAVSLVFVASKIDCTPVLARPSRARGLSILGDMLNLKNIYSSDFQKVETDFIDQVLNKSLKVFIENEHDCISKSEVEIDVDEQWERLNVLLICLSSLSISNVMFWIVFVLYLFSDGQTSKINRLEKNIKVLKGKW